MSDTATMKRDQQSIESAKYDYDYGDLPDMRPGSKVSKFLCAEIKRRKESSHKVLERMHSTWNKISLKKNLFVPLSSVEKAQKAKDDSLPLATIIPHMVAANDTLMSAFSKTYLRKVLHRYEGFGSAEAIVSAILRERVIAEADQAFGNHLHIMTAVEQAYEKGVSLLGTKWSKRYKKSQKRTEVTPLLEKFLRDSGVPKAMAGDFLQMSEESIETEGTEYVPVDMWNAFIDPAVNFNAFNKAEFAGYMYETFATQVIRDENDPELAMFNGKYARLLATQGNGLDPLYNRAGSGTSGVIREDREQITDETKERLHLTFWTQHIIPSEWNLSSSKKPELWRFITAGDYIVLHAGQVKDDHESLGFAGFSPTTDGLDLVPLSMLGRTYGIQEGMDWLIRSHMHEVMAAGARFLYNPLFIDPEQLFSGRPNAAIPLRPAAYYREDPIGNYFQQLQFNKATQGHWGDIQSLREIAKDTDGTVDIIKGDLSSLPERPGQAGIQSAVSGAVSRIDYFNRKMVKQAFYPLANISGKNVDQYISEVVWISMGGRKDVGELRELFGADAQQVGIGPEHMVGDWRVVPHDEPSANGQSIQSTMPLATLIFQNPAAQAELLASINPVKWFMELVEADGGSYSRELLRRVPRQPDQFAAAMMDDESVEAGVQSGNLVTQGQANQLLQRAA